MNYEQVKRALTKQKFEQISLYREIIELGVETKWKQLTSTIPPDSNVDPADVFDEEILQLQDLEYHGDLLTISFLSELWEQELYNYLSKKARTPKSNFYKDIKKVYEEYTGENLDNNEMISQMREVVNAIKHGENCISFLKEKYPTEDFLETAWTEYREDGKKVDKKRFDYDKNALTSQTLNLKGKFEVYQKAILKFWDDLYKLEDEKKTKADARSL